MSSIIKTLVAAALAALGVSCAWVGSRTEPSSRQSWQIPLSVQLKLSKTLVLSAGETVNAVVTLKNRSDHQLYLLVIGDFFYVTATNVIDFNSQPTRDDLTVKEAENTLLVYPSLNTQYRRGEVEYTIKANESFSSRDIPVTFGRAGRSFVRGIVRIGVQNVEGGGQTEVMLYSRETLVNVGK